ncbi:MAG: M48 family metalloprotease, partial [Candidatus Neomarinimicrobiota bacterium]
MNNQIFHPLLDSKKQIKARAYEKEKREIGLIFKIFFILALFLFYFSGGSSALAGISDNPRAAFLIYMVTFITIYSILALPLKFYSEYKIEHKWGFSNHSIKSWLKDELKGYFVSLALILIITGFLFWIWQIAADNWWIWAGLAMAVFSIILTALFPVLILPIFNKYIPIENPELVDRLGNILSKYGLNASGFFKQDLSLQTKKENAFLTGLWKTRRVVLSDNLLENMTLNEIESVIAHEVGHYYHHHLWKQVFLGAIQQFILFYLLNIIILKLLPNFLESLTWNLTIFPLFILIL